MNRSELKQNAKRILGVEGFSGLFNTKMVTSFIAVLIVSVISGAIGGISYLIPFVGPFLSFLALPLTVTLAGYFLKLIRNQDERINDVLDFGQHYGAFFSAMIWQLVKQFLASLPATMALIIGTVLFAFSTTTLNIAFIIAGSLLTLGSIVLFILAYKKILLYVMIPYIIRDNPQMTKDAACAQSVELMQGHQGEYFVLMLSFIPWSFACILVFPAFFVIPYYETTMALYYQNLVDSKN